MATRILSLITRKNFKQLQKELFGELKKLQTPPTTPSSKDQQAWQSFPNNIQLKFYALIESGQFFHKKIGASGSWAEPNFARRLRCKRGMKHPPGML